MTEKVREVKRFFKNYAEISKKKKRERSKCRKELLNLNLPLVKYIRENPKVFFAAMATSPKALRVLNVLLYFVGKYGKNAHPSQRKVSILARCSWDYAKDMIGFYAHLGVIKKFSRASDHDTLHYHVDDFFRRDSIKSWLHKIVPNCMKLGLSLCLLMHSQKPLPIKHSTTISSPVYIYKTMKLDVSKRSIYADKETSKYYNQKKEEWHRSKCIETQQNIPKQLEEIHKGDDVNTPVVCPSIRNHSLKYEDIPEKKRGQIEELPENQRGAVIKSVLLAMAVTQEIENGKTNIQGDGS